MIRVVFSTASLVVCVVCVACAHSELRGASTPSQDGYHLLILLLLGVSGISQHPIQSMVS